MNAAIVSHSTRLNSWRFFALAIGLSWLFWLPVALSGQDALAFPWALLFIVGGVGLAIAEVILIAHGRDKGQWRDYWQRVLDFRRISAGWYAVILLTFSNDLIQGGISWQLNVRL